MLSFCAVVPAGFFRGPVLLGYLLFLGGGGCPFLVFFFSTRYILVYSGCLVCILVSWFTHNLFRYITFCLTKWPIFTLLSWSRHVFFRTFDQKGFLSILSHVVYQILIDTYVHVLYVLLLLLHFLFNPINNISVIVGGCCCCFFCCDNSFFIHLPYPLSYKLYMLL